MTISEFSKLIDAKCQLKWLHNPITYFRIIVYLSNYIHLSYAKTIYPIALWRSKFSGAFQKRDFSTCHHLRVSSLARDYSVARSRLNVNKKPALSSTLHRLEACCIPWDDGLSIMKMSKIRERVICSLT